MRYLSLVSGLSALGVVLGVPPVVAPSAQPTPTTTTAPATTPAATTGPTTIVGGQPVQMAAGDYLLTVSGVTAPAPEYGSVMQTVAGAAPARDATFLATATPQTVTAQVRVSGPSDTFTAVASPTSPSWSTMSLTPASWGFVVRGQTMTSPTSSSVTWHGVNVDPGMLDQGYADLAATYRRNTIVRLVVNEECWDPFFVASQSSKYCPPPKPGGPIGSAAYQAQIQRAVADITASGEVALVSVDFAGRDVSTWYPPSQADLWGPDQQTLVVYRQFAKLWSSNPLVVFETTNEPKMDPWTSYAPNNSPGWSIWLTGGAVQIGGITWSAPGVQQIVDQLRSVGASNPVMVEGANWGDNLLPVEQTPVVGTNVLYSFHAYNSPDNSTSCPSVLNWQVAPVVSPSGQFQYLGFLSEFGTTQSDLAPPWVANGSKFLQSCINFAVNVGAGWAAFAWYPTSYNAYGLLKSYQPLAVTSRGATVAANF